MHMVWRVSPLHSPEFLSVLSTRPCIFPVIRSHTHRTDSPYHGPLFAVASIPAAVRRLTTVTNPLLLAHDLRTTGPASAVFTVPRRRLASSSNGKPESVLDSLKSILQDSVGRKSKPTGTPTPPPAFRKIGWEQPFELQSHAAPELNLYKIYGSPQLKHPWQGRTHIIYPPEPCSSDASTSIYARKDYHTRRMRSFLQILTTPTADTVGTTLMLHFDDKRYLFGSLGEGTQRAMNELGARMLKINEIFITGRCKWSNTGGLIGMMLTLADAVSASNLTKKERGVSEPQKTMTMFGPPNLNYTIATCRHFVFRKGMPIDAVDIKDEEVKKDENGDPIPMFVDHNTKVWAMAITPAASESSERPSSVPPTMLKSRKRSHDELEDEEPAQNMLDDASKEAPEETASRYERMTRAVVGEMFNSNWRLDALVEKPLSEVRLPATIFQRNSTTKEIEKYAGPIPNPEHPDTPVLVRTPWPGAKLEALPPAKPASQAISYIIHNHPQRGKFVPQKAIDLKVPKGRLWSQLQAGQSVQNENGETISPEMVLEPSRKGNGLAIVDLPSPDYVDALVERDEWKSQEIMTGVMAFVWILGPGVASHPALKKFMAERKHLKHVVSSADVCPNRITFDSAAAATLRLGQVDQKRFGVPYCDDKTLPQERFVPCGGQKANLPAYAIPAKRGQIVELEPRFKLQDEDVVPLFNPEEISKRISEDVLSLAKEVRESIESSASEFDAWRRKIPLQDAEIISLGTGSALPSKHRNVSATLVRVPGYGSYLLDAGENTLGQLQRVFKPAELVEVLKELRIIWLSHMHADHILGAVSVIKAWYEVVHKCQPTNETAIAALTSLTWNPNLATQTQRLAVISDVSLVNWLAEYSSVEDFGYSRLWPLAISANMVTKGETSRLTLEQPPSFSQRPLITPIAMPPELYPALLGLSDIQAVYVTHCHEARAVAMTWPDATRTKPADPDCRPFKISYSGDCRPSLPLTRIGRHSTVLVHEATFEDRLAGNALAKKHSTTSEALAIGARMKAKMTLLTHFSQRYQRIPVIERENARVEPEEEEEEDVDVAAVALEEQDALSQDDEPVERPDGPPRAVPVPAAALASASASALSTPSSQPLPAFRIEESGELHTKIRSRSDMRVGMASDYMRVKVGEFAELERYVPALQALLAQEKKLEEEEEAVEEEEAGVEREDKGVAGKKEQGQVQGKKGNEENEEKKKKAGEEKKKAKEEKKKAKEKMKLQKQEEK